MQRTFVRQWVSPILLATILAIGALATWMLAVIWTQMAASPYFSVRTPQERLLVTMRGQALRQWVDGSDRIFYRTLEGEPVADRDWPEADSCSLPVSRADASRLVGTQILSFGEPGDHPLFWYLVPDDPDDPVEQRVYFEGFDSVSKRRIGYIGAHGYRPDPPLPADQIVIGNRMLAYGGVIASRWWTIGVPDRSTSQEGGSSPVFIVSEGKLLSVDLGSRTVREVPLDAAVASIATYTEARAVDDERGWVRTPLVAVRLPDRILIIDWDATTRRTVPIPAELRSQGLSLYNNVEGDTILAVDRWARYVSTTDLYFVNAEGQIVRRGKFESQSATPQERRNAATVVSLIMPLPVLYSYVALVGEPLSDRGAPDYTTALGRSLYIAGPGLAIAWLIGLLLAVWCYRWHRRYDDRGALVWAVFVLLTGPVGLVGYLVHRRWPARERCGKCGVVVPRDREECLACAAEFPQPALEAIEIFA